MGSTVTVSIRTLGVAVVMCAAVVVAFLLGSWRDDDANAANAANAVAPAAAAPVANQAPADTPNIVMSGTGTATAVPDQLTFAVEVRKTASDVSIALTQANRTTRAVLAAVAARGVDRDDVRTTGLDIRATYDYSDEGPPVITGYAVSQRMSVLVRSLPDAGETLSAAAEAGGNAIRLHNVELRIGDEDGLLRRARAAAIDAAKEKAEQYAQATGQTLGEVLLVRESGGRKAPRVRYSGGANAYMAADLDKQVPIRAGSGDLEVSVQVVWALG